MNCQQMFPSLSFFFFHLCSFSYLFNYITVSKTYTHKQDGYLILTVPGHEYTKVSAEILPAIYLLPLHQMHRLLTANCPNGPRYHTNGAYEHQAKLKMKFIYRQQLTSSDRFQGKHSCTNILSIYRC